MLDQESKVRKKAAVQPAQDEVKSSEVATPLVETNPPVSAETETVATEPNKPVVAAVAVKKVAAKPKVVAEKPAPKPKAPAKPVKKASAAAAEKVADAPKVQKAEKASKVKKQGPKKPKLVRDSFTIPETDYALFASIKQRALTAGTDVKKAEILRAAVATLATLDDAELVKAISLVERIKTGRPKK